MNTSLEAIKDCKISDHLIEVSIQVVNLILMNFDTSFLALPHNYGVIHGKILPHSFVHLIRHSLVCFL